ncbi:MAG: hypothetical protein ACREXP_02970 [Steroidobacteraceae bacterium]
MTITVNTGLSALRRAVIMRMAVMLATIALVGSFAERAAAQQPQGKRDDLDVTMQIIVDPDAKLPDEVVRRIPLPARKPAESPPSATGGDQSGKPETAGAGKDNAGKDNKEHANEAREHGRETSEAAKERSREATEQREAARRAEAEERRRERGPPDDRPNPPNRPPRT